MEIIKGVIAKVWRQENLHLQHQGSKTVLIARKEDGSVCIAFSDKKILKINNFLEVQDLIKLMYSWGKVSSEKVLEVEVPPPPVAEATGVASGEKVLTEEGLNLLLDQRDFKMRKNFENKMEEIKNKVEEYQNSMEGYKNQVVSSLDALTLKLEKVLQVKGEDEPMSEGHAGAKLGKAKPKIKNIEIFNPSKQMVEFLQDETEPMDQSKDDTCHPHPKWVALQGARISSTNEHGNESLEDGEIDEYEYIEDWDQPDDMKRIRKETSKEEF